MKAHNSSMVPRVRDRERGQTLVMVPLLLALLLAAAAVAIDMGNLYYCYDELKSATRAAALAGGAAIVSQTANAVDTAYQYSGWTSAPVSGPIYNIHPNLNVTSAVAQMGCISITAYPNYGLPACTTYGVNTGNSIRVTETANVNTFFARVFGVSTIPISATAVAGATGGGTSSWNVAIVLDTTPSMNTQDTNCGLGRSATRLDCALDGVQTLLKTITPCPVGSNCTATSANDRVSLFTFPNVSAAQATKDSTCASGNPVALPTTFPSATATSYSPASTAPTYQITGYLSNYQGSKTTSPATLSGSSNLVMAAGGGSCNGMGIPMSGWPGGVTNITYYAGTIYAAQASLLATQAAYPLSQNAMILLSDGDAANDKTFMASGATSAGTYPSWVDQCGQAVAAANAAMAAGTRVYSVAYGSASTGCSTDTTTAENSKGITPCQTMEGIAGGATSAFFYSDYNQSGTASTCQSASQPITNLHDIFLSIAESLTGSRLVPGNLAFTAN